MQDDILSTITAKSDQLNACDLIAAPITVKVLAVNVAKSDQPVAIKIDGDHQPFKPCLTVRRILAKLWGASSSEWVGQSMTLYCDETIMWAGEKAGGIRVSHVTGITSETSVVTRASKHKVMSYIIKPLIVALPAYSDADIEDNKELWLESFKKGTKPESLINRIQTKFTLTPDQIQKIKDINEGI